MTKTLRVRFSGLCLFHKAGDGVVVRVVKAPGHTPQLWLDLETGENGSGRKPDFVSQECALALVDSAKGTVKTEWRTVAKYVLDEEMIEFANGRPESGPKDLPGVAPLTRIHPDVSGINQAKGVGAIIKLNRGEFRCGPCRAVTWEDKHPKGGDVCELPLWTDLLIVTEDDDFTIKSSRGDWQLKPELDRVDIWVFADGTQGSTKHFRHLYDVCLSSSYENKPWPKLKKDLPECDLPGCDVGARRRVGSTFCPDGESSNS